VCLRVGFEVNNNPYIVLTAARGKKGMVIQTTVHSAVIAITDEGANPPCRANHALDDVMKLCEWLVGEGY